jgi:two-component system, response regulator RegA
MRVRSLERILVVEASSALAHNLSEAVADMCKEVRVCHSVSEAEAEVAGWWPDLVLLEITLHDGDAHQVLALLERRDPVPLVIAMSAAAGPTQSFELARRGVRAFLEKPLQLHRLQSVIQQVVRVAPDLRPLIRQIVGHKPLPDVESEVRAIMIDEALARTGGSRSGAARLLGISRQLMQYALRRAP